MGFWELVYLYTLHPSKDHPSGRFKWNPALKNRYLLKTFLIVAITTQLTKPNLLEIIKISLIIDWNIGKLV